MSAALQSTGLNESLCLPPGWQVVRLGEIAQLVNGDAYKDSDWSDRGAPIIRIQNLNDPSKPFNYWDGPLDDRVVVESGDVLLAWSGTPGTSFGAHLWRRGKAILNQHIFRVDLDKERLIPQWAVWAINQQLQVMIGSAHGGVGLRHVKRAEVESLVMTLPPLSEQRRITAIVAEKMAAVEDARMATEAQVKAAKALPPALICGVFDSPEAGKWPQRPMGEVLRLRKEIVHPYEKPRGRATFVGLEHLESQTGKRIGSEEIEMSELVGRKPRFHRDDIVYGYLRPYLNKVWVAEFDGLCSVDQYVYSVDRRVADVHFVGWFMRSATYLNRAPITSSPGQLPRIRTEEVASVLCGFPSIEEQRRTVSCIEAEMATSDRINGSLKGQLAAINGLPAAFLRRAFSGEL